jgi:hypothetical protein
MEITLTIARLKKLLAKCHKLVVRLPYTITHSVNIGYQSLGSPPPIKQEMLNTERCLETALYILKILKNIHVF